MQIYANVRYVSKSLLVLIFVEDLKKDRNKKTRYFKQRVYEYYVIFL